MNKTDVFVSVTFLLAILMAIYVAVFLLPSITYTGMGIDFCEKKGYQMHIKLNHYNDGTYDIICIANTRDSGLIKGNFSVKQHWFTRNFIEIDWEDLE